MISGASEVMAANQPSRVDEHSILQISTEAIIPNPRQPRRPLTEDDPKLLELSASIQEHGLLQPLVVTRLDTSDNATGTSKKAPVNDPWFVEDEQPGKIASTVEDAGVVRFQIIAGERRWRASRLAGLKTVPVVVKEATPLEMLELASQASSAVVAAHAAGIIPRDIKPENIMARRDGFHRRRPTFSRQHPCRRVHARAVYGRNELD